jgi:hypothetical protein
MEKDLKIGSHGLMKLLSQNFLGEFGEYNENAVRIVIVPA